MTRIREEEEDCFLTAEMVIGVHFSSFVIFMRL